MQSRRHLDLRTVLLTPRLHGDRRRQVLERDADRLEERDLVRVRVRRKGKGRVRVRVRVRIRVRVRVRARVRVRIRVRVRVS